MQRRRSRFVTCSAGLWAAAAGGGTGVGDEGAARSRAGTDYRPPPSPIATGLLFLGLALGTLAGLRSETVLSGAEHLRDIAGPLHMQSAAERPRTVVTPVSSHGLTHVPGKRQTAVLVTFPPGAFTPEHHHGGSVYVYVLSGTIRSQLAGEPPGIYGPGDSFFEPLGITHLFAENVSATEPAQALAVFIHDEGATLTTYH